MNTVVRELPAVYFEGKAKDADQVVKEFSSSFCFIRVELPTYVMPRHEEMSDTELLLAAESAGTFRFLDDDTENAYQP